jgi:DNA-binding transcriptional ArsR family regulator
MANQRDECGCKIGRVTAEYGMSNVDARLVERWRSGTSVRRLTEELNEDIVESELDAANVGRVEWSRSPVYEALHTDELSDAEEIEIRRELDRAGVDVEQLSSDLVSHQTVYRHLTRCLDASKGDDRTPDERRETAKDTVYALRQRTEIVTESTLDTLQSAGITDLGEVEVLVDLRVVCSDCGRSMDFESAIDDGCNCPTA